MLVLNLDLNTFYCHCLITMSIDYWFFYFGNDNGKYCLHWQLTDGKDCLHWQLTDGKDCLHWQVTDDKD